METKNIKNIPSVFINSAVKYSKATLPAALIGIAVMSGAAVFRSLKN